MPKPAPKKSTLPTKKSQMAMVPKDHVSMYYGPPGVGKTTFVNGLSDNVLFISTDRGTRHLNALRKECFSWKQFDRIMDELEEPNAPEYEIICIDHIDDLANMAEDHLLRELKVEDLTDLEWGKGWKAYRRMLRSVVNRIMKLGSGVVFIAHETAKQVKIAGVKKDKILPEMSKSAWKVIVPLTDIVGYCGLKTVKVSDGKGGKVLKEIRFLQTQPDSTVYAKDRTKRAQQERGWDYLDAQKFMDSFNTK